MGMISLMEKEEIESKPTSYQQNEYFLSNCLMRGTQKDIMQFRSALIDTYQKHLADILPTQSLVQEEPMDVPSSSSATTQGITIEV